MVARIGRSTFHNATGRRLRMLLMVVVVLMVAAGVQEDEGEEMMKLLQSTDRAANDRRLNADLRAKIYEQTRLIAELRHDEVNRQQTSKAHAHTHTHTHSLSLSLSEVHLLCRLSNARHTRRPYAHS